MHSPMPAAAPLPLDIRLTRMCTWLLCAVALALALAALARWAMAHPVFMLERIVVAGEVSRNNALTLQANVAPHVGGDLFATDLQALQKAFEAVPWVRQAVVRREFPNRLRVHLSEHQPSALWGDEGASTLLNRQGQIFEADMGAAEAQSLPRLKGPAAHSPQVLAMYQAVAPALQAVDMEVDALELTARGNWTLWTDQGAVIEMGRGQPQEVVARTQQFLRTLAQVAGRHGRTPKALVSADLRHTDGYALRLQGVTTTDETGKAL